MKLSSFLILGALSFGGFTLISWQSVHPPYPIPKEATQGKQVWQEYNCISCHTLFGNGGYYGEDMTHIVSKRSSPELITYFVSPPVMRPNHKRLHPQVSQDEAQKLVQYFKYIDQIPTLGWPPKALKLGKSP